MTHADLIDAKGTASIAEKTGRPASHVRVWKNRGIPRSAWPELMEAYADVTLDVLKAGQPAKRQA